MPDSDITPRESLPARETELPSVAEDQTTSESEVALQGLGLRLATIEADVTQHKAKLELLQQLRQEPSVPVEASKLAGESDVPETLLKKGIENLKEDPAPDLDKALKATHLLNLGRGLRSQIAYEHAEVIRQQGELLARDAQYDTQIDKASAKRGLAWLRDPMAEQRVEKLRFKNYKDVQLVQDQKNALEFKLQIYNEEARALDALRKSWMDAETKRALGGILKEDERWLEELLSEPHIMRQLESEYLERYTIPSLVQIKESQPAGSINEAAFADLLTQLRDRVATEGIEKAGSHDWTAKAQAAGQSIAANIVMYTQSLFGGAAHEAVAYLATQKLREDFSDYQADSPSDNPLETMSHRVQNSRVKYYLDNQSQGNDPLPGDLVKGWLVARQSPQLQRRMGYLFKKTDQQLYKKAVDLSFESQSDGAAYILLQDYATPETVRTLMIQSFSRYRTDFHGVNKALTHLATQPNWSELLDETCTTYPAVAQLRPYFQNWSHDGQWSNEELQDVNADTLVQEYLKDHPERQVSIAEIFSTDRLLKYAQEYQLLSEVQITDLEEALQLDQSVSFEHSVRRVVIKQFNKESQGTLQNLLTYVELIKKFKEQPNALAFLADGLIASKALGSQNDALEGMIKPLIEAHGKIQLLLDDPYMKQKFVDYYQQPEDIDFLVKLTGLGGETRQTMIDLLEIVHTSSTSREVTKRFALENPDLLATPMFDQFVRAYPHALQIDGFVDFMRAYETSGIDGLNTQMLEQFGKSTSHLGIDSIGGYSKNGFHNVLVQYVSGQATTRLKETLASADEFAVTKDNWRQSLIEFLRDGAGVAELELASHEKLKKAFESVEAKNLCLALLTERWTAYLHGDSHTDLPLDLQYLAAAFSSIGAGGPLSQVESLLGLMTAFQKTWFGHGSRGGITEELFKKFASFERQLDRQKWDNTDRADVRKMQTGMLEFSPQLADDVLHIFSQMPTADAKQFAREIFPLYRAWVALVEGRGRHNVETAKAMDAAEAAIRAHLGVFGRTYAERPVEAFAETQHTLQTELLTLFKERFGLIKLPETYGSSEIRSLKNISTYLANLANREPQKEAIIGAYLGLLLNQQWHSFRAGQPVEWQTYLESSRAQMIEPMMAARAQMLQELWQPLGLDAEARLQFVDQLQRETTNIALSNIQTVDTKLAGLVASLEGLRDPDLYNSPIDKARVGLVASYPADQISKTVAQMFRDLKSGAVTGEKNSIYQRIEAIFAKNELPYTQETLKQYFQTDLKPFTSVGKVFEVVEQTAAQDSIESLRQLLLPPPELVPLFQRMGENFTPNSGVYALPQDLDYLTGLVGQHKHELKPDEALMLGTCIDSIRDKLGELTAIYGQIAVRLGQLKQSFASSENQLLKAKLAEMEEFDRMGSQQSVITSAITTDLNVIMENIRECLSTANGGCNNDTDLTFGDSNKFFVTSRGEVQEAGSIADQIVFLEPIDDEVTGKQMGFVLDQLYGKRSSDLFMSHVDVVLKKATALNIAFPQAKMAIVVPKAILGSGALTAESFVAKFSDRPGFSLRNRLVSVDVVKSALADHYVEFGGASREAGVRKIDAFIIEFAQTEPASNAESWILPANI